MYLGSKMLPRDPKRVFLGGRKPTVKGLGV